MEIIDIVMAALFMHSFIWSFCVMLPAWNSFENPIWLIMFAANICIHFIVDDFKANRCLISLWQDQLIHMAQIVLTAWAFTF